MFNDRITKVAFLISLSGHLLLFGMPGIHPRSFQIEKPEEITVRIEIEKPPLLPKVDIMVEEKKLKEETRNQSTETRVEPKLQPEDEKIVEKSEEVIEDATSKEENLQPAVQEYVKVLNPNDEAMLRYQDMIKQRIEEVRRYPTFAKRQGIEGVVHLSFTVLFNGLSKDIKIVRSSGSNILDEEAAATIKRANPFPTIPKEIGTPFVQIEVSIVFRLE